MQKKLKLGVLVSHPIQYFVPVYRELANVEEFDLTVIYRTRVGVNEYFDAGFGQVVKWDIPLLEGYRCKFLSDKNSNDGVEFCVLREILSNKFDVILVHGYSGFTNLLAIFACKFLGVKVLMRGDTRVQMHHRGFGLKIIFKRMLFKLCNGFIAIGTLNREYYARHGVGPGRLFFAPFCVRNEQFFVKPDSRVFHQRGVRSALGLPSDSLIVLFASKLIKLKKTDDLIRAFSMLTREFPSAYLVIAGSGEEENTLKSLAEDLKVSNVRFIGFQNQSELGPLYAASDIFVLPSHIESWGLVINEVMAAGLPVIVSSEVGAAPDLVDGKGTGIVYPCGDLVALSNAIRVLLADPVLRKKMGDDSIELIKKWSVSECVKGISHAVQKVVSVK